MKKLFLLFILIPAVSGVITGFSPETASRVVAGADDGQKEVMIQKYPENFTCFLIKAPSGVKIIADPFGMDEKVRPDIVTESHNHFDHSDHSMLIQPYKLLYTPGDFTEKGIKITGIAGHHNKGDSGTTNIMYVFDIDGIRIAEFGSQGDMPGEADLKKIGTVDVLIVQLFFMTNDKLTMNESLSIIKRLGAKIIIPAHGDSSTATHNRYAKILGSHEVTHIKSGRLTLTRAELDKIKAPKIVVLDR